MTHKQNLLQHISKLKLHFNLCLHMLHVGRDSSVGIAIGYELDGPGNRILVEPRLSAPVQTGPGTHPASCTMGTVSFPGVKSSRGMTLTLHPPSSAVVIKE
jgi:hypothetical protein